jgi:hypothetical protein
MSRSAVPSPAHLPRLGLLLAGALVLFALAVPGAAAAPDAAGDTFPSLGGYLEESLAGQVTGARTSGAVLSHLRLKLAWPDQEGASARGEFDLYGLGGAASGSQAAVDRLYLRLNLGETQATLGRQRISWGNGTAFSPADVFNPPNPLDPEGPRRGADGLLVRRALGPLGYVAAAAAYDAAGALSGSAKFGAHAGHTDFDLGLGYDGAAGRHFAFTEAQGDLGVGWHAALAWLKGDAGAEKLAGAAGLDYSYAGKLVGMVEYAAGPLPGDVGADGTPRELPRWVVGLTYLPSEVMSLGAHVLVDTAPRSPSTAVLSLTQTLTSALDLTVRLAVPFGEYREESARQGAGDLRLRYSF